MEVSIIEFALCYVLGKLICLLEDLGKRGREFLFSVASKKLKFQALENLKLVTAFCLQGPKEEEVHHVSTAEPLLGLRVPKAMNVAFVLTY